ncbi:MAG: AAA family ATPase [Oscillatoriales cyanobacterium SM2_1_8]|nr:AAA family ATPase [Oscillatoriales cyanobacterium SM2_1_8]
MASHTPLILGIHGPKGEGKSFQCDLAFRQLGIEPIKMSSAELENPDAGDPSRLLRLRYREASERIRVRGQMCALVIHDLDVGVGRVDRQTQYTVNTQLVSGTLMNIADDPTNVQLPGSYDERPLKRVPIVVTGNDLATLYAPLVRDGRMEKFYWEPDRVDRIGMVAGMFAAEGVARGDIEHLVDAFPEGAIDFFAALRSRLYDDLIREFISTVGLDRLSLRLANSAEAPPEFRVHQPPLAVLLATGRQLLAESDRLQQRRLIEEYL